MPRVVTASEAEHDFPRLLRAARGGETITITEHGKPVAQLVPEVEQLAGEDETAARERRAASVQRFLAEARKWPVQVIPWTRDDLYDDNW